MSGGSFNPAGSSFGHIGFNHRTDSWDATTDYAEGDTVLYDVNGSTYYCHTSVTGDAANTNPAEDQMHWHAYTSSALTFNAASLADTGDILVKFDDTVRRLRIGVNGRRLFYSEDGEVIWYNPGAGNARGNIANRTFGGSNPVSERYAAKEELETHYYSNFFPIQLAGNVQANRSDKEAGTFHWIGIIGEFKYGFFNRAGNSLSDSPYSGSQIAKDGANIGYVRDGRFFRHTQASHFGGLIDMSNVLNGDLATTSTSGSLPATDHRLLTDQYFNEARTLETSNNLTLNLNEVGDDLEWKIFNESSSPHNRNLYVLDYVRSVGDFFTFLCAPADNPNSTTRTLWQIGGVRMRSNMQLHATSLINHSYITSQTGNVMLTDRGSYIQFGVMFPPQFAYDFIDLIQIAAPGNYEELYLLDEAYQFNSPFFVGAENMATGTHVLVKMQDGTWELHTGFVSEVSGTVRAAQASSNTSTAQFTYPADVVTRDHLCVSDPGYAGHTASMIPYNASWGGTGITSNANLRSSTPDAIGFRNFFNAWKSGQSVVSIQHGNTTIPASSVGTLTVGDNETVKQIKCFCPWLPRTGLGYSSTGDENRHPTDQRMVVLVVTEEGNVWISAQEDNSYAPLTDDTTASLLTIPDLPTGTANVNMVKLSGAWDGNVQRVETKCFTIGLNSNWHTRGNSHTGTTSEQAIRGFASVFNLICIITDKSMFVHSSRLAHTRNSSRGASVLTKANLFINPAVGSGVTHRNPVSTFNHNGGTGSSTASTLTLYARWVRGDIPHGNIERVVFATGGELNTGQDHAHITVVNDSGNMYTCVLGNFSANSFTGRFRFDLRQNNSGAATGAFGTNRYNINREF